MKKRSQRLEGKKIALCVTGSIAAVESVKIARELRRRGAAVSGYMSRGAQEIIHPNALESATGQKPVTKLTGALEHLAKFDLLLIAPATANTIGKLAYGIADNPVTSLALASSCSVIIAPAMHREMYSNPVLVKNIEKLRKRLLFVGPNLEEDAAKMAPIDDIIDMAIFALTKKDLNGKSVVITAGPTAEPIDPVRVVTNRSSGKMGIALAKEAKYRGAAVTLIYGPGSERPPESIATIHVQTAREMAEALKERNAPDIFIAAAAVSDFRAQPKREKIDSRKGGINLHLTVTPKILSVIDKSAKKVGFKAEYNLTENELVSKARSLLKEHDLDLVVANDISRGILGSDETEAIIVDRDTVRRLERMEKSELATMIFDRLMSR